MEPEVVSAIANTVIAITSIVIAITSIVIVITYMVIAITSIALVIVAVWQLPLLVRQLRAQGDQMAIEGERERKWATVKACDRYSNDPIIFDVARRIWDGSQQGTNYTNLSKIDKFDVAVLLNYFEGMAAGIGQGIFFEEIVKEHFEPVIDKAVKVFLRGESGEGWKAKKSVLQEEYFPALVELHSKWFP